MAVLQNLEPCASQGAVWDEVAHKSERMATQSQTGALHDIYDGRREQLTAFRETVRLHDDQAGALVCITGEPAVIDYVSRPDAFAALHGPLLQGYGLDALEADAKHADADPAVAQAFLDAALGARVSQRDGISLGVEIRFTDPTVGGAGLVVGQELVQLTAFAEHERGPGSTAPRACIRRPSRRRNG